MIWYIIGVVLLIVFILLLLANFWEEDRDKIDLRCKERLDKNHTTIKHSFKSFEDYINSFELELLKIRDLPDSFKIGNVFFNKQECKVEYFFDCEPISVLHYRYELKFIAKFKILSYVEVDGKVYDNGFIERKYSDDVRQDLKNFKKNTSNIDLYYYILNNLDKVEEVKE